jgi:hypothetical protein
MRLLSPISRNTFKALLILMISGALAFMLNSCGRCDGCWERGGIVFSNFSGTEMDSVIIKEYVAGTNFTRIKDSFSISFANTMDTVPYTFPANLPDNIDSPQPDILVYLPADSLTYKITNITTTPKHCRCKDIPLYSFTGYNVNGVSNAPYNPDGIIGGYLSVTK